MILSKAIFPKSDILAGCYISLEPLNQKHYKDLWQEVGQASELWQYLLAPSFSSFEEFTKFLKTLEEGDDNKTYVCILKDGSVGGYLSLMHIDLENSRAEIGRVLFGSRMQRTTSSTESIFLIMKAAFEDLHFRRLEWRCNSLNQPSIKAANRYGFLFEGRLRNHMITKGKSRDTLIFSMLKEEWCPVKTKFEKWLSSENFDEAGNQKFALQNVIFDEMIMNLV